jgi:hypothetical protein
MASRSLMGAVLHLDLYRVVEIWKRDAKPMGIGHVFGSGEAG